MKSSLLFRSHLISGIIVLMFLVITTISFAQEPITPPQDWIRQYDGIPILADLPYDWAYPDNARHIDSMKKAGIDAVFMNYVSNEKMNIIRDSTGFRVIPAKSISLGDTLNWIEYYTDAKYTVWETEDNTDEDTSYFVHDSGVMFQESQGGDTYLKLKSTAAGNINTLIRGPYYGQNVYGLKPDGSPDTARYRADFRMKFELNDGYLDNIHSDTPLCVIKVTQSSVATEGGWHLPCTYVIDSLVITRGQIGELNKFINFSLEEYNLLNDSCTVALKVPPQYSLSGYSLRLSDTSYIMNFLMMREYIEFQVVWLGKANYLLSIDKVTVYDQKGLELLVTRRDYTKALIELQANSLSTHDDYIAGWLGVDEPNSIDKFAPIKRVIEILNNHSNNKRPLWLALMGRWDGVWNQRENPFGTYHLSPWKEMKKRIGGMNVWQNIYYIDYPYRSNYVGPVPCNCTDYRAKNIHRLTLHQRK